MLKFHAKLLRTINLSREMSDIKKCTFLKMSLLLQNARLVEKCRLQLTSTQSDPDGRIIKLWILNFFVAPGKRPGKLLDFPCFLFSCFAPFFFTNGISTSFTDSATSRTRAIHYTVDCFKTFLFLSYLPNGTSYGGENFISPESLFNITPNHCSKYNSR